MALLTQDNGILKLNKNKAMGYRFGLMARNMKVIGIRIKLMEGVDLYSQMVISMMEIGKMIKLMELVLILTKMELNIQVNGRMINKKEQAKKLGLMALAMKDHIKKVKR
jgi:hypothetical protein